MATKKTPIRATEQKSWEQLMAEFDALKPSQQNRKIYSTLLEILNLPATKEQ